MSIRERIADWLEDFAERVRPTPPRMTYEQMIEAQRLVNRHMTQHLGVLKDGALALAEAEMEAHRTAFEKSLAAVRDDLRKRRDA